MAGFDLCPQALLLRGHAADPPGLMPIEGPVLARLGDSITTDHISPAGAIKKDSPAGAWLIEQESARPTSTHTAHGAATTR